MILRPIRFEWKDADITPTVRCSVCRSFTGNKVEIRLNQVRWDEEIEHTVIEEAEVYYDALCVGCEFWLWRMLLYLRHRTKPRPVEWPSWVDFFGDDE